MKNKGGPGRPAPRGGPGARSFEQRLLAYSAMAGAASFGGPAQAAGCNPPGVLTGTVCYTDLVPDVTVPASGEYLFDFDHDGDAEVRFFVTSSAFGHHQPALTDGGDQLTAVVGSPISALTSGAVVSAGNALGPATGGFYNWIPSTTRFGGVRISLAPEGTTHFGWFRLSRNANATYTVRDFAYRTQPDAAIDAGQTTPVELQSFEIE